MAKFRTPCLPRRADFRNFSISASVRKFLFRSSTGSSFLITVLTTSTYAGAEISSACFFTFRPKCYELKNTHAGNSDEARHASACRKVKSRFGR